MYSGHNHNLYLIKGDKKKESSIKTIQGQFFFFFTKLSNKHKQSNLFQVPLLGNVLGLDDVNLI